MKTKKSKKKFVLKKKKVLMAAPKRKCGKCRNESTHIPQFIKAITEKRYNAASKYLTQEIEAKLKNRILANI